MIDINWGAGWVGIPLAGHQIQNPGFRTPTQGNSLLLSPPLSLRLVGVLTSFLRRVPGGWNREHHHHF